LALLSKEIAASLPLVILIYELYRGIPWRTFVPSVGAFGAVLAGYFVLRYLNLGTMVGGYKGLPADPSAILPTLARYLGLMLAPYNPNLLGMDYSPVYLVTLFLMAAFVLTLMLGMNFRDLALFVVAFLVTFLPVIRLFMGWLNGFPGYGRFEQTQHIYLPSAFFCAGLALMICSLRWRRVAWIAAVGLVAFYAVVQQVNNGPWLRASDLVHAAQRNPERLPVSGYEGAFVFPYQQETQGRPLYMGYDLAMSPWFRGSSTGGDGWRDWPRVEGTVTSFDANARVLKIQTSRGRKVFVLDRENPQVRIVGGEGRLQQLRPGWKVSVSFVREEGDTIVRAIQSQPVVRR